MHCTFYELLWFFALCMTLFFFLVKHHIVFTNSRWFECISFELHFFFHEYHLLASPFHISLCTDFFFSFSHSFCMTLCIFFCFDTLLTRCERSRWKKKFPIVELWIQIRNYYACDVYVCICITQHTNNIWRALQSFWRLQIHSAVCAYIISVVCSCF